MDLNIPVAAEPARLASARSSLATVCEWGGSLPLALRLAAAAAMAELEARADLPYPPAQVPVEDPVLTPERAVALLASARASLAEEIPDADPVTTVGLAFAVRELDTALDPERDKR